MTPKQALRIAAVVVGWAIYGPAVILFTLEQVGPRNLQALLDIVTGRCTQNCGMDHLIHLLAMTLPIAATIPAVIWLGILWIRRSNRSDEQVSDAQAYFAASPERQLPAGLDEDLPDPDHYRDRRGRVRRPDA